ncbi:MAG: OmpA family protein [Thermodesulfobacteriota bacterium]|nr:OmpA family protein [Thermodesulfobacteriota bacterium]
MKLTKAMVLLALIFFSLSIAVNVMGENKDGPFTMTPFGGGYTFEGNQNLDDGPAYGLGLGYNFNKHWSLETVLHYVDTESEVGSVDVDTYLYRLDAIYHFRSDKKLVPYLSSGFGGITFDPEDLEEDTDLLIDYGSGVKYYMNGNIALRGDLRHIISFDETHNNLLFSVGLTFLFGGKKQEVVVEDKDNDGDGVYNALDKCPNTPVGISVDNSGCPLLDSDGDGVYDSLDKCPNTPVGISVDNSGCPLLDSDGDGVYNALDKCPNTPVGISVDNSGCPLDSDGDGVYNALDKCPNTPVGISVDNSGCPLDSDGDGVYDSLDKCSGTPKGAEVDKRGCWVIKGVLFNSSKWDIKPDTHNTLDDILAILEKNPMLKLEIQGHTDNQGSMRFNKRLSENRARSVMEYLVSKGIEQNRLRAKGLWFSVPAASNDTPEGRAKNRRVELSPIR